MSRRGKSKSIGDGFEYRVRRFINEHRDQKWSAERNPERDHFRSTEESETNKYDLVMTWLENPEVEHFIECKKTTSKTRFLLEYKWLHKIFTKDPLGTLTFSFMRGKIISVITLDTYATLLGESATVAAKRIPNIKTSKGAGYIYMTPKIEGFVPFILKSVQFPELEYVFISFDIYIKLLDNYHVLHNSNST